MGDLSSGARGCRGELSNGAELQVQQAVGHSAVRQYSKRGSRAPLDDRVAVSKHQQGGATPWGHLQLLPRCPSTRGVRRGWPPGVLQLIPAATPPILGIPLLPARGSQGRGTLFSNSSLPVPSMGVPSPTSQGYCTSQLPSTERWPGYAQPGRVASLLPWIHFWSQPACRGHAASPGTGSNGMRQPWPGGGEGHTRA